MGLLDRDYFVEDSLRRQGILKPGETLSRPRPPSERPKPPSDRPSRPPNVRGEKIRVPAGWTKPARNRDRWQAPAPKPRTLTAAVIRIAIAWIVIGLAVYAVIAYAPAISHRLDGSGRTPGMAKPPAPSTSTPAERFRPVTST